MEVGARGCDEEYMTRNPWILWDTGDPAGLGSPGLNMDLKVHPAPLKKELRQNIQNIVQSRGSNRFICQSKPRIENQLVGRHALSPQEAWGWEGARGGTAETTSFEGVCVNYHHPVSRCGEPRLWWKVVNPLQNCWGLKKR